MKLQVVGLVLLALITTTPLQNFGQHTARRNRVWSMKVKFETCGLTIKTVNTYKIVRNGDLTSPTRRGLDYFYFQWSHVIPTDPNYGIYDLLSDISQDIYIIHVTGTSTDSNHVWTKFFWVSPFGYSTAPIPRAPRRKFKFTSKYSSEDLQHINFWLTVYHKWSSKHFWSSFRSLRGKLDTSIEMPIKLAVADCKHANGSHVNTKHFAKEVYYA